MGEMTSCIRYSYSFSPKAND